MTQAVFPEIQAVAAYLTQRIELTESEIAELRSSIAEKDELVHRWRDVLAMLLPEGAVAGSTRPSEESEFFDYLQSPQSASSDATSRNSRW
jgi:hypothetical protein